ncbi:hypothetical protein ACOMHN_041498 [Nucella lapillus]
MVRRGDLLKVFFVYLCLLHVTPGHPCGRNPISRFQPLTKMLGRDINSLLNLLRTSNPALYQQVQDEWRRYADCVGLVDTGYFKRSMGQAGPPRILDEEPHQTSRGQMVEGRVFPGDLRISLRNRRAQRLLSVIRAMAETGGAGGVDGGGVGGGEERV